VKSIKGRQTIGEWKAYRRQAEFVMEKKTEEEALGRTI
jgi:hypothetical protein